MPGFTMILVLEIKSGLLHLFSSIAQTEAHLEAIDVENNEYEFCDDSGQRLVGEIITAVTRFRAGSFRLKPVGVPDKAVVASFLYRTLSLECGYDGITSLTELRSRLAV